MMLSSTIARYTLTTGHMRESPRTEVADDVVAMLLNMIEPGWHDMPGFDGYRYECDPLGDNLRVMVTGPHGPLVEMWVCVTPEALAAVGKSHGRELDVDLPACLVDILPECAADMPAMKWIGDFERCLAWAWIERINGTSGRKS